MSPNRKHSLFTTYVLRIAAVCLVLAATTIAYAWSHGAYSKANSSTPILTALIVLFATAQSGDWLLLNGKKLSIQTNPLEPFLQQNPEARPRSGFVSTGNWRGYTATWQVKDQRLMLIDIETVDSITETDYGKTFKGELRSVMSTVFPGRKDVFADWFTGYVVIPDGELVEYVHMGYASTYEKYLILRLEKGIVTRRWNVDNAGFLRFRDAQFENFKRTEEYRRALSELFERTPSENRRTWSAEETEEFLRTFYSGQYTAQIFDAQ